MATLKYFNPNEETEKHGGAYLPHWFQEGVLYFVTFRLADSLPQNKLKEWTAERDAWLAKHPEPHSPKETADYYERFPRKLEEWLDAGYGSLMLNQPAAKECVERAIRYFEGERYSLDEFVVAGNHVHVLVMPKEGHGLSEILHSWKSFTSKELMKLPLDRVPATAPTIWQKESWDHIVRSEASMHKFREYIRAHTQKKCD